MTPDRDTHCVFCSIPAEKIVLCNELAYAIWDASPVTPFHGLIIPKRHVPDFFCLTEEEVLACSSLLTRLRGEIYAADPSVDGFNIGINNGLAAGQTILHCHTHLIPRRTHDVSNPRGGIRHVIPGKGDYQAPEK